MRDSTRRAKHGFMLLEILIVLAIIALIASIGIPAFLRSKINANEMVAISTCRTLTTALESFRAAQSPPAYPAELEELSAELPAYLDTVLTSGSRRGYSFEYERTGDNQYQVLAKPEVPEVTGVREFYVDESGVIRVGSDDTGAPVE